MGMPLVRITGSSIERTQSGQRSDQQARQYIAIGYLGFYIVVASLAAAHVAFPNHYDELAQLSYVVQLAIMGMPKIGSASMVLLDPALSAHFTTQPNYLNHPPAYYFGMGLFLPPSGWPTERTVFVLRYVNVLLSAVAVGCALGVGLLRRIEIRLFALYGAMIVLAPVLPYLGGAINNDNLGILGGCVCLLGAQMLEEHSASARGWVLLASGCALAALAKLTATIMTLGFALAFIGLQWRASRQRPSLRYLLLFIGSEAVACMFYAWFVVLYGTPAPLSPSFDEVYRSIAALHPHLHGWLPGQNVSFVRYLGQFVIWLVANWNPVTSMSGIAADGILLAPVITLLLALLAFMTNNPLRRRADSMITAGGLALAMTAALHVAFSYHMYRLTGSPPLDAVPRYYFPLALIILPLAACWTLSRMVGGMRVAVGCTLAIGLMAATPLMVLCGGASACN